MNRIGTVRCAREQAPRRVQTGTRRDESGVKLSLGVHAGVDQTLRVSEKPKGLVFLGTVL
jgi:hypothetical protein